MHERFDSVLWRAKVVTLAEKAMFDHQFHGLYDVLPADPAEWDYATVTRQLKALAKAVPKLARKAKRLRPKSF